jgi:HK97 family phage major capsid protein
MCGLLKTGYNPVFGFNRFELAYIRTLKDGQGRYIWTAGVAGLAEARANTVNGYPYMEMPDLDVQGANLYPAILGDFMRGYTMVDDVAMGFIRDPYTLADSGKVKFVTYRRLGGAVHNGEAIVKLRCQV